MSIPRSEIVNFITLLCQHRNLKVTVNESLKGAALAGLGALLGGLLGGPRGLAIGGATAAVCAGIAGTGKYKSAIDVIREDLTDAQREELADSVWRIVRRVNPNAVMDAAAMLALVLQNGAMEGEVVDVMSGFFAGIGTPLSY